MAAVDHLQECNFGWCGAKTQGLRLKCQNPFFRQKEHGLRGGLTGVGRGRKNRLKRIHFKEASMHSIDGEEGNT